MFSVVFQQNELAFIPWFHHLQPLGLQPTDKATKYKGQINTINSFQRIHIKIELSSQDKENFFFLPDDYRPFPIVLGNF